ncbi:MAG: DNA primase [Deltaproteobacteria bacterium]|nr:DNA primase [Deltaproteobacteria bacterium]
MDPLPFETKQRKGTGGSPDFQLLLRRLEAAVTAEKGRERLAGILSREAVWKRLPPESAMRWAKLAQIMGLCDLSLQVLAWVNTHHPQCTEAWQQRIELLELLGKHREGKPVQGGEEPLADLSSEAPRERFQGRGKDPEEEIKGPFAAMRERDEALDLFLRLFQGREDCFARQWVDRQEGTQGYIPVRRPMTPKDVAEHLAGSRTYGIYLLQMDSRVRAAVVDADLVARLRSGSLGPEDRKNLAAEKRYLLDRLPEISREKGMPCLTEFSGGKGFHFWYLFSEPVAASSARQALGEIVRHVASDLTCFNLEVFPKQDRLAGKGLGNLVKLPLGIHRGTGKPSFFTHIADRSPQAQLAALRKAPLIAPSIVADVSASPKGAEVVVHPRHEAWAAQFPELALLGERCIAISRIMVNCRRSRELSVREEKVLLGTVGFLPRARSLLHHIMQALPDYNPHLTDFRLSRLRGKPLGCRKIHALLNLTHELCPFENVPNYTHPLLHLPQWTEEGGQENRAERIASLDGALEELKRAIRIVERFVDRRREN